MYFVTQLYHFKKITSLISFLIFSQPKLTQSSWGNKKQCVSGTSTVAISSPGQVETCLADRKRRRRRKDVAGVTCELIVPRAVRSKLTSHGPRVKGGGGSRCQGKEEIGKENIWSDLIWSNADQMWPLNSIHILNFMNQDNNPTCIS